MVRLDSGGSSAPASKPAKTSASTNILSDLLSAATSRGPAAPRDDTSSVLGLFTQKPAIKEPSSTHTRAAEMAAQALERKQEEKYSAGLAQFNAQADSGLGGSDKEAVKQGDPDYRELEEAKLQRRAQQTRAKAANRDSEEPNVPKAMTWEDYEKLSPYQQAGVKFNTALVSAVRSDLKNQGLFRETDSERKDYTKDYEDIFGKDEENKVYAPRTVGLLKKIKFDDPLTELDDFLKLRVAIDTEDLKNLGLSSTALNQISFGESQKDRMSLQGGLTERTMKLEQSLAKGGQLLDTFNKSVQVAINPEVEGIGGITAKPKTNPGYGVPDKTPEGMDAQIFNDALAAFANTKNDDKDLLAGLSQAYADKPEKRQELFDFLTTKAQQAEEFDIELGDEPGVRYRRGKQVLSLLDRLRQGAETNGG